MRVSRLIIVSVSIYAVAQALAPFSYALEIDAATYGFVLLMVVCLLAGAVGAEALTRSASLGWRYDPAAMRRALLLFCGVASVGVLLRLIDLFVFRSGQFGAGQDMRLLQIRLAASSSGSGAGGFSALAALLSSMSLFGLVLFRHFRAQASLPVAACLLALGVYPAIEALVARGGVFALGYVCVFAWFTLSDDTELRRRRPARWSVLALVAGALVLGGGVIFRRRVDLMFGSVDAYQAASSDVSLLRFPDGLLESARGDGFGFVMFTVLWLLDYALQGFAELNFVLLNFDEARRSHGAFQFDIVMRGLALMSARGHEPVDFIHPRPGKYSTLLSDAYMDFGMLGCAAQMALLGFLAAAAETARRRGGPFGLVFGPLLKTMLIVGFLSSVLPGARFYTLLSGLFVWGLIALCGASRPAPEKAAA